MWNLCRGCARQCAKEILEFKIIVNGVQNANVNTVTDKTFLSLIYFTKMLTIMSHFELI